MCSPSRQRPLDVSSSTDQAAVGEPAEDVPVLHREAEQPADRRAGRAAVRHHHEDVPRAQDLEAALHSCDGPLGDLRAALAVAAGDHVLAERQAR